MREVNVMSLETEEQTETETGGGWGISKAEELIR